MIIHLKSKFFFKFQQSLEISKILTRVTGNIIVAASFLEYMDGCDSNTHGFLIFWIRLIE